MTTLRVLPHYRGGKSRLADWVISFFPAHQVYVEPYCGGASVLLNKPPVGHETINDIDGAVVNLFRVLRGKRSGPELVRQLKLTPFARSEYDAAFQPTKDKVEWARRTVVRSCMAFASGGLDATGKAAFRKARMGDAQPQSYAPTFRDYADQLHLVVERLRGVHIENRDALACITDHDGLRTLHFVDPPYLSEAGNPVFAHSMTRAQHEQMLDSAAGLEGIRRSVRLPRPALRQAPAGLVRGPPSGPHRHPPRPARMPMVVAARGRADRGPVGRARR